ncbi:TetR/AcrR family transcriptional regulator [Actinoplanes sp. NPDC049265]|uniref:TetR/AcrR family transcriptional regulator n=1 Tax=Actinoplanes sp. NPDC049265 TaxID=3363902 RepID=UPI00371CBFE5
MTSADPYRRRRAAGAASRQATRQRLLTAADTLFRKQGYPATTVAAIAELADVSLQTLYLAWGNKRALLRAASQAALAASDTPVEPDQWRATVDAELAANDHEATARSYLAAVSTLFVRVAERTSDYWQLQRDAAATDPEVAADWHEIDAERRRTMAVVAPHIPADGLRPGLEPEYVVDTLWCLASPQTFHLMCVDGDMGVPAYRAWLEQTLVNALCRPA